MTDELMYVLFISDIILYFTSWKHINPYWRRQWENHNFYQHIKIMLWNLITTSVQPVELLCGMVCLVGFALLRWMLAPGMPWRNTCWFIVNMFVFFFYFLTVCWQTGPDASPDCGATAPLASTPLLCIALSL